MIQGIRALHPLLPSVKMTQMIVWLNLQEFEKQSEIMDMKEEMMNDSIDEAMEGDDDEEERYASAFWVAFIKLVQ